MTDPMKTASERLDELLGSAVKTTLKFDLAGVFNGEDIRLTTTLDSHPMFTEVIRVRDGLKDKAVREALIALGWTPPKDDEP